MDVVVLVDLEQSLGSLSLHALLATKQYQYRSIQFSPNPLLVVRFVAGVTGMFQSWQPLLPRLRNCADVTTPHLFKHHLVLRMTLKAANLEHNVCSAFKVAHSGIQRMVRL